MSAGSGVLHSEFNASRTTPVHFLQIWIQPSVTGVAPSYEQKRITRDEMRGRLRLIASPDGRDGSAAIHQDATVHAGLLDGADVLRYELAPGRRVYVHVVRGDVHVNGVALAGGDAAKITGEREAVLDRAREAELLLFDLP